MILKYIHHQAPPPYKQQDVKLGFNGLQKLYFLLRSKTGHDFSLYKQDTLLRRIERRMKVTLVKNLDEYVEHVQKHPEEIEALFREMLINVTYFFRDPAAYQALNERAIYPLIQSRKE
jgi:two-component system CheB/CheR fusion protein